MPVPLVHLRSVPLPAWFCQRMFSWHTFRGSKEAPRPGNILPGEVARTKMLVKSVMRKIIYLILLRVFVCMRSDAKWKEYREQSWNG